VLAKMETQLNVSSNSDNSNGQGAWQEEKMGLLRSFQCPINAIPEVKNETSKFIETEEEHHVAELIQDNFLFAVMKEMFTATGENKCVVDFDCKASSVALRVRNLSRRANWCCQLVKEATKEGHSDPTTILSPCRDG